MPLSGWYPDPRGEARSRWHDGEDWTDRTSDEVDGPGSDAAAFEVGETSTRPTSFKARVNRWAPLVGVLIGVVVVLVDVLNNPEEKQDRAAPISKAFTAGVGDAFSLNTRDTNVLVRLNEVVDPVVPGANDPIPPPGTHLVGMRLTIKNAGGEDLSGSLLSAVNLEGTDDSGVLMTSLREGECKGEWLSDPTLAAGEKRSACVAFSLPDGETPQLLQLTTDSSDAQNTGQWEL